MHYPKNVPSTTKFSRFIPGRNNDRLCFEGDPAEAPGKPSQSKGTHTRTKRLVTNADPKGPKDVKHGIRNRVSPIIVLAKIGLCPGPNFYACLEALEGSQSEVCAIEIGMELNDFHKALGHITETLMLCAAI